LWVLVSSVVSANGFAADADSATQSAADESKRLLISTTWEARIWGPFGTGYYPTMKCQEQGPDVVCAYSGGKFDQNAKYEVLPHGELRTKTTRGVPITLMKTANGFETEPSREAGIKLSPKK
jgi:hypothetical protein